MKQIFFMLACIAFFNVFTASGQSKYLNPTGTYKLEGEKRGEDTFGNFGEIQVKVGDEENIVMTFSICKGAPSYNSGSFVGILKYDNNIAVFANSEFPDCKITFTFDKKGVKVKQEKFDCGFGAGVYAEGYYKKVSSEEPIMKHPETGEELDY
jgi:outer membrane protease